MEINEMTVEQIEERIAQINGVEINECADIESVNEKVAERKALEDELESRKALASAKAEARAKIADGEGSVITSITSEVKEERKMFEVNSVEYRTAWLKTLQGKDLSVEERDGFTQTGTNAVPTIVADKFFEKMKKLAPMLNEITLMRVAGNLQFVAEGTRNTASKHTENSVLSDAGDSTVKVSLGAYEFMKVIYISKSAKMMAIDAFEGWLVEILSGDLARAIDNFILNDDTNGVAALTYTTGTNQILNTATTGFTYKNICDLIALLPAAYDAEAKFLVNKKTLYGQIAAIVDNNNRPIFVQDRADGLEGNIMGFPVLVDDYVTTANNAIYLGKWTDVVGNLSEGPEVEASLEAGFTSGSIVYRGYASFDSKPAKGDAIVRLVSTTA